MRLLLDADVVVDYASQRGRFFPSARLLAELAMVRKFDLWMSSTQATDVFYLLSNGGRRSDVPGAREALRSLRSFLHIVSVTESDIDKAVDADWGDFEDACAYYAARKIKADAIITRNRKDFAWSSIKVFDCDDLFAYLEREVGVSYADVPWG